VGEVRGYRFLDGQYPDREEIPALPDRFETAAYPLEAFTDVPFTSEHELHLVDLMLDDLEQGRALALPEAAAAAQPVAPMPPAAP
jgi:hypothetical protein